MSKGTDLDTKNARQSSPDLIHSFCCELQQSGNPAKRAPNSKFKPIFKAAVSIELNFQFENEQNSIFNLKKI